MHCQKLISKFKKCFWGVISVVILAFVGMSNQRVKPKELNVLILSNIDALTGDEQEHGNTAKKKVVETKAEEVYVQELQPDGTYLNILLGYNVCKITDCIGTGDIECDRISECDWIDAEKNEDI